MLPWLDWLQYPNLGTVSAPQTHPPSACFSGDLHLAKADYIDDSTYCLLFRQIVSGIKFQFQNTYLRFSLWFITNIHMVIAPPDLSQ